MSYIFAMPLWLSFLTIHILSCLTFLLILFNFSYKKISPVINEIDEKIRQGIINHTYYYLSPLRAPPR
jgi:hypothetical protein